MAKIALSELIARVNNLFEGDLTPGDKLVYVNDVIRGKLMESEKLIEQAMNNTKEQFANSPDLTHELINAVMDALRGVRRTGSVRESACRPSRRSPHSPHRRLHPSQTRRASPGTCRTLHSTHFCAKELVMKTRNTLLSVVTTVIALAGGMPPCGASGSSGASAETLQLNKAVTRRVYEEGLSQGRFEVPYSDRFVGHGGAATFTHAQGMAEARGWRDAFPDLNVTVDLQVAENDLVAVRWTARGTNTGSGNGLPETGRAVQINGTTLFRIGGGKIAEEWTCANSLGLMRQLGLLPAPVASTGAAGN